MNKRMQELQARYRELEAKKGEYKAIAEKRELNDEEMKTLRSVNAEMQANVQERQSIAADEQYLAAQPKKQGMTPNQMLREAVKLVREHKHDGSFNLQLRANSQNAVSSAIVAQNDTNNMTSAGLPIAIEDLIKPMEDELIYSKLGMKLMTGVHGQIVWPYLDNAVEATVGGETDAVSEATLDFSKVTPSPVKIGLAIPVTNEAINDAAFDLQALVIEQLGRAIGRTLNKRVIALSAPSAKADFVGPLKAVATATGSTGLATHKKTFAGAVPTYSEIADMESIVFATNAQRSGAAWVMTPAMWNKLRHTFVAEGNGTTIATGTIDAPMCDGYPVFLTTSSDYTTKIGFGYFGYEALLQHGIVNLVIDPYTAAKKNEVLFVINADFSLTSLAKNANYPFAVGIGTV